MYVCFAPHMKTLVLHSYKLSIKHIKLVHQTDILTIYGGLNVYMRLSSKCKISNKGRQLKESGRLVSMEAAAAATSGWLLVPSLIINRPRDPAKQCTLRRNC